MSEALIEGLRPRKGLGQVFLHNRDVIAAEAAHCSGKTVLEIGPGHGYLTEELCRDAKKVIAIEKDRMLYKILKAKYKSRKLKLINADFMELGDNEIGVQDIDIVISNIPYYLSSSMIDWLSERRLQAVLCLQKEFVMHMMAKPGSRDYSRLSVMSTLMYRIVKIMDVSRGCFTPVPRVDSVLISLQPKDVKITAKERLLIGLLMQHKKKTVRNAIVDAHSHLDKSKDYLRNLAEKINEKDKRIFSMEPEQMLKLSKELSLLLE